MNLLGFNISRTVNSPPAPASHAIMRRSIESEWLSGASAMPEGPLLNNAYEQVPWVYRAINIIAEQVANIPFLFSHGDRGRERLITSGPLNDFYSAPHPHINRFEYWELRVIWLMLRGECIRVPIFDHSLAAAASCDSAIRNPQSALKSVLILDPARFQHIIRDQHLIGWRYTGFGPEAPLASQVFLPEEVWFEKLPNPFNFWRGFSPLQAAALAAKTDSAASSFMRGLIENNCDTGVIVRTEKQVGEEQREQIVSELRRRKRRAGIADRPLFLEGVSEISKPELSSADLQFLENRKFTRSEICSVFGVPEEIVASTDHNKYDVMQGARRNFIENRVAPLCRRLEAAEEKTVRLLDPRAIGWFDIDSLPIMQDTQRARIATARQAFEMGIPFNELNRVMDLGFKKLPWGEKGYVPSTMQQT